MKQKTQRASDGAGGALGLALLALLVIVVAIVASSSSAIAPSVRYEYDRCMAAAQTPADQKACDPTAPTPATKP